MKDNSALGIRDGRMMDFVMECALGAALAILVLFGKPLLAVMALCLTWLAGMALVERHTARTAPLAQGRNRP